MEKSIVYVSMEENNDKECSYAIVDKGEKSVIIIFKDLECAVYDYEFFKTNEFDYKYLFKFRFGDVRIYEECHYCWLLCGSDQDSGSFSRN